MENAESKSRLAVSKAVGNNIVWDKQLFRKTSLEPKNVVNVKKRMEILETFHDEIGHWDVDTTW